MADGMPEGYKFLSDPDEVAAAVLKNSTWAVLALILEIELFTQEHYKQSIADVDYFLNLCNRSFTNDELQRIKDGVLGAYRWQYIFSGFEHQRFQKLYQELTNDDQRKRVSAALVTLA